MTTSMDSMHLVDPGLVPTLEQLRNLEIAKAPANTLGIDPNRIAVGGESSGGGLAASLALLARDRGEVRIAFQHLLYPMIDDRTGSTERHPFAGQFVWTAEANRFGWECLLGQKPGAPGVSPYAAAARAETLSGLPPAFICVGALDLFLDENISPRRWHGFRVDFARRLKHPQLTAL